MYTNYSRIIHLNWWVPMNSNYYWEIVIIILSMEMLKIGMVQMLVNLYWISQGTYAKKYYEKPRDYPTVSQEIQTLNGFRWMINIQYRLTNNTRTTQKFSCLEAPTEIVLVLQSQVFTALYSKKTLFKQKNESALKFSSKNLGIRNERNKSI